LPERPGLGSALRPEVLRRPDVHVEVSGDTEDGGHRL